jgi:hypothetical protein
MYKSLSLWEGGVRATTQKVGEVETFFGSLNLYRDPNIFSFISVC